MLGSLSLSLWLERAHSEVCLPADRFQMLMAGSRCEGAAGGFGGAAIHCGWGEKLLTENSTSQHDDTMTFSLAVV